MATSSRKHPPVRRLQDAHEIRVLILIFGVLVICSFVAGWLRSSHYEQVVTGSLTRQGYTVIEVNSAARTAVIEPPGGKPFAVLIIEDGQDFAPALVCPVEPSGQISGMMCSLPSFR